LVLLDDQDGARSIVEAVLAVAADQQALDHAATTAAHDEHVNLS